MLSRLQEQLRAWHTVSCTGGMTVSLGGGGHSQPTLMGWRNWVKGRALQRRRREQGRRERTSGFYSVTVNRGVIGIWESCSG